MSMFANLGRTLGLLRELRGKTQAQLAREAGIGKSQLCKYENGRELPKLETLEKLLLALGAASLDLFYTLTLVDEGAAHLDRPPGHCPLALPALLPTRPTLVPPGTDDAFRQLLDALFRLYGAVERDRLRR